MSSSWCDRCPHHLDNGTLTTRQWAGYRASRIKAGTDLVKLYLRTWNALSGPCREPSQHWNNQDFCILMECHKPNQPSKLQRQPRPKHKLRALSSRPALRFGMRLDRNTITTTILPKIMFERTDRKTWWSYSIAFGTVGWTDDVVKTRWGLLFLII